MEGRGRLSGFDWDSRVEKVHSRVCAEAENGLCRAPYDNIFTMAGMSLRKLAAKLPSEVVIQVADAGAE